MKLAVFILVIVLVSIFAFFGYYYFGQSRGQTKLGSPGEVKGEKPLEKYTIDNLGKANFVSSEIELGKILKDEADFVSLVFYFKVQGKRVSGQLNWPKAAGTYPLIVMSRGYIEREGYKTGDGTRRSSEEFAKAGFVTVAPDFLGYGESDMTSDLPIEERFETYMTVLTLLESVPKLNDALLVNNIPAQINPRNVGLWGHSNGGQIALTVLEATGKSYPTVLWAPVSKPFPYSILYYTDDFDDHGKALRKVVADFERDYDSELYSITNYLDRINAQLSVHQGSADSEVPINWSGDLVLELKKLGKKVQYHTYPEDDHNFTNGNWSTVVGRNIEFFKKNL